MKKGVYAGCFPESMPLEDRFALAREVGFDAIEIRGEFELVESSHRLDQLRELAKRTVPVCSIMGAVGWNPSLTSGDAAERVRAIDIFGLTIRAAARLGADTVLVVPGRVSDQVSYDQAWERAQAGLKQLAPVAEDAGVCLAIENVWNKFLLSPREMRQFVDEIGSPAVQSYFDVGNVLQFGYPEQWIATLGQRIKKVHVKDFKTSVGNITGFCQLLDGDVNWPVVIAALRTVGYDGYITAEVPPYKHFARKGLFDLASSLQAIIGI